MSNCGQSLQEIEFCLFLTHPANLSKKIEKLAPVAVFHAKEEVVPGLKTGI
jgi:hypothetical protein